MGTLFYTRPVLVLLFICCLAGGGIVSAQTVAVGSAEDKYARSLQLLGRIDSSISFTVRPLTGCCLVPDETIGTHSDNVFYRKELKFARNKIKVQLLPLQLLQQVNTHHPFGWNDGPMISARGYQVLASAGVAASAGPLEVQLRPEMVYAADASFENSTRYGASPHKALTKLFPGQSSVRLSVWNVSAGVATENLWWGPGIRSSLLMSNNAPGFLHGFLRSRKPIRTPVGNFEWNLIGARLTSDSSRGFENFNLGPGPAVRRNRYLNGYVISYNPKWMPGMFFGMTRMIQTTANDIGKASNSILDRYLPILFKPVEKKFVLGDDSLRTDQLASFFFRWLFTKAKAEFYIEYGYNDYGFNLRDYTLSPSHSAAYLVGFRKVIPQAEKKWIEAGIELTQMSQTPDWMVRDAGNWYEHSQVTEGYTNQNQIMGAGAGYGTNVLSLDMAWVNGWKRLGFIVEQIARNPQQTYDKWVDFGVAVLPQIQRSKFVFSGKFELVSSKNYMWEKGLNRLNFHAQLGISYLFQ